MTKRIARIVVGVICVFFAVYNSHVFVTFKIDRSGDTPSCVVDEKYLVWDSQYLPYLTQLTYSFVPSSVIISCNLVIGWNLYKRKNARNIQRTNVDRDRSIYKIVPMLLVVSTVFVGTTLPYAIYYISEYLSSCAAVVCSRCLPIEMT